MYKATLDIRIGVIIYQYKLKLIMQKKVKEIYMYIVEI